jgi:nucleosome binding factor SPN SPT16 subunit
MVQDGGISLIRINFNVPGAAFGAGYGPALKYPDSMFLREVSYRSSDARHSNQVVQLLKTMRRQVAQRENERAERATLVTQERLQLSKGQPPTRPPASMPRPAAADALCELSVSLVQ